MMGKWANDDLLQGISNKEYLLQANDGNILVNDGEMLVNDGEMSVWSYNHLTIIN